MQLIYLVFVCVCGLSSLHKVFLVVLLLCGWQVRTKYTLRTILDGECGFFFVKKKKKEERKRRKMIIYVMRSVGNVVGD